MQQGFPQRHDPVSAAFKEIHLFVIQFIDEQADLVQFLLRSIVMSKGLDNQAGSVSLKYGSQHMLNDGGLNLGRQQGRGINMRALICIPGKQFLLVHDLHDLQSGCVANPSMGIELFIHMSNS